MDNDYHFKNLSLSSADSSIQQVLFSMFKKTLLSLTLCFGLTQTSIHAFANDSIQIGKTYQLTSAVLKEQREIQIYLPQSYEQYPNQTYPVIYLLDGESNFHYLTAIVDKLSKAPYPSIPEMIVVGIVNTERSRDLTPTVQKVDAKTDRVIEGQTGGNATFFNFLENELMPDIEKKYRSSGFNIMIGHSFGGITALNHMLNGQKNMQAYIVHDPSIWWDNEVMLKAFQKAKNKNMQHKQLFLTQAGGSTIQTAVDRHDNAIQKFNQYLSGQNLKNLNYKFAQYTDENHGSVTMKGNLDALRYLFDGMQVNIKAVAQNPNLVKQQYAQLSQKLGYSIQPSEAYLDTVLTYLKRSNQPEVIQQFRDYTDSIYPQRHRVKP